ncbi:fascin domain-containing protein [Streptomyces sp. NPDC055085]
MSNVNFPRAILRLARKRKIFRMAVAVAPLLSVFAVAPQAAHAAAPQVQVVRCTDAGTLTSNVTGLVVSAELGFTGSMAGELRARTAPDEVGAWERFQWCRLSDGNLALKSMANGKWVSAELDSQGELRARADAIGPWEEYRIFSSSFGCSSPIDGVTIRMAYESSRWVSVTNTYPGGMLKASDATPQQLLSWRSPNYPNSNSLLCGL